jgi:hypothetical protein
LVFLRFAHTQSGQRTGVARRLAVFETGGNSERQPAQRAVRGDAPSPVGSQPR